jgi:cytochrome c
LLGRAPLVSRAIGEAKLAARNGKARERNVTLPKVCVIAGLALLGSIGAAAAQDAAAGEQLFKQKCKVCHQIGEGAKNFVGPELNGVVGRHSGTAAGYNYSDANKNSGIVWDEATLKIYLKDPKAKVPGTKMVFPGLPNESDIDNVIAFLKQFDAAGKKM